ncbi:MAG TPA: fructosamine kinase family protein [Bacillales bacterium]|nr:fructosamine kinase family protein [Bacillales bacterium]
MRRVIEEAIKELRDSSEVKSVRSVSGGEINEAFKVTTGEQRYFVKLNSETAADFFEWEARGLELLRSTETVAVPEVYFCGEKEGVAVLVLEWIEGQPNERTEETLGRDVARMHCAYGEAFGLDYDNYIGTFDQRNGWQKNWVAFLRDNRLAVQAQLAEEKGRMNSKRRTGMERILERLGRWVPRNVMPSPLHGDLWGGNWIVGNGGKPYLIDPAVFYGHYEFELAFTELFGGYSNLFYEAYREILPIPPEYEERRPLYQLYYLLVHLNEFGEAYGGSVDRVLRKYGS